MKCCICEDDFTPGTVDDVFMGGVRRIELNSYWGREKDDYLPPNAEPPDDDDDTWKQLKECIEQLKRDDDVPPQFSVLRLAICGRKSCRMKLGKTLKLARAKASPPSLIHPSHEQERQLLRQKKEAIFPFRFLEDGLCYEVSIGVFRNWNTEISEAQFDQIYNLLKKATTIPRIWEKGSLVDWMKHSNLNESMIWWRLNTGDDDPSDDIQNAHRYFRLGSPEMWCAQNLNVREIHDRLHSSVQSKTTPKRKPRDASVVMNMGVNIDLLITAPGRTEEERDLLLHYKRCSLDPGYSNECFKRGLLPLPGEDKSP